MMELYKIGSPKSEVVRQIQKTLKLYPDGIYGKLTEEAVKVFQADNGLKVDGIVGPATLSKLFAAKLQSALTLKKCKRTINEIIVHCTATPEYKHYTVTDIRRWHTTPVSKGGRGWSDIGYHYVVDLDGTVEEGRDVDISGAHCVGHNTHSIGVCYVGGMTMDNKQSKDTRTELQKNALLSLLIDLKKIYRNASIHGHRDFANKDCPSFDATAEYRRL